MATLTALTKGLESAAPSLDGEVRYVARQPILNLQAHVHGYELLFRNAAGPVSRRDGEIATQTMLDNAIIFGLDRFTNGLPAFISCTEEALTEQLVNVLAPGATVLALPATLQPTPKVLDACLDLKQQGFRIALDVFDVKAKPHQLVQLADYIRVDFTRLDRVARQALVSSNAPSVAMVARKVDTQENYRQACAEGFTLFQGNYLCHPVLLKKRKVPTSRLYHFEIVQHLLRDPIDIPKISRLVMRDASLTFRLLRLVNSPVCAIQQEVRSIESAILVVGEEVFRRMVSLAVLSELNADRPPEILHMALVRARFCELAAAHFSLDPAEQYLLGLLSLVPAMLRLPMEELIPFLPLRDRICDALQGTMNSERSPLSWLEFHERGDWESCDAIVLAFRSTQPRPRPERLIQAYSEAVIWAQSALSSAA
ncbi:MAG: HDOD domain-containing protein [Terracidiphilus sp.]|jgi:EAL and modified HD-GYP domain-containing signal transduction protein